MGANGSGKTTLLNILAGDVDASAGSVSMPRRIRLGVLRQDRFLYEDEEVLQVALMGNADLWAAMAERDRILADAGEHFDAARFSELEDVVERNDGYTAESRAAAILEGLGLPAGVHRHPLSTLSGGFRLRVLLAQVLASAPDALLLDEPTNHLDILSIRWLEKFLRGFRGPVVVISHDHRFLDNVATRILDLDYETVLGYPGNYTGLSQVQGSGARAPGKGDRPSQAGDFTPSEVRGPLSRQGFEGTAGTKPGAHDRKEGRDPDRVAPEFAQVPDLEL